MTAPTDQAIKPGATTPRRPRDGTTQSETAPGLPLQARSSQPWDQDGADIGGLIRPILEALATLADMESTYLTVFDWEHREQEVRFVFALGQTRIQEGHRLPLPEDVSEEAFPGVTRSPDTLDHHPQPDSLVARRLGLKTFVSVPVTAARHRLFGMLCGASRDSRELSESVIDIFESFAAIVTGHLARVQMKNTEAPTSWSISPTDTTTPISSEMSRNCAMPLGWNLAKPRRTTRPRSLGSRDRVARR